jgi:putative chitobiose transport system substrate-binding protein
MVVLLLRTAFYHSPAKWFGFLLLCLGVVLSLCGCRMTPPQPTATKRPVTITFWTMQLGSFAHVITPMLKQFEAEHPGVTVQWVDVPFSEMEKRVLIGVLSDQPPDVVNLNPTFSALLAQRGALLNMAQAVDPKLQSAYLPVAWTAVSLSHSAQTIRFGLPWYLTTALTYWNTQQVRPPFPTDWPALVQLKPARGFVTLPAITDHGALWRWLAKQGTPPCDPNVADGLALLQQGFTRGVFPSDMLTTTHRAALEQFQQGKLAMLVAGSSVLNLLAENAPERLPAIHLAPQFGHQPDMVDVATMLLAVPTNSPHPELAVALAQWVTNSQNQLALAQAAPVLPSIQPALDQVTSLPVTRNSQPVTEPTLKRLLLEARRLSVSQLKRAKTGMPVLANQTAVNDQADSLAQQLLLGTLTPNQVAARLCDTVKAE